MAREGPGPGPFRQDDPRVTRRRDPGQQPESEEEGSIPARIDILRLVIARTKTRDGMGFHPARGSGNGPTSARLFLEVLPRARVEVFERFRRHLPDGLCGVRRCPFHTGASSALLSKVAFRIW